MARLAPADEFVASLGFEAYRVGGSVRDELLGRRTKDADYVVRATPTDMLAAINYRGAKGSKLKLRDGQVVGARTHVPGVGLIELVMPRREVSTGPGHRDFAIEADPTISLDDDARRRDFTINALYKYVSNPSELRFRVIDPLGRGSGDLAKRLINTTYPTSFRDDPLRVLRAARFASVLGFTISAETFVQMAQHHKAVHGLTDRGVSGTALTELSKLLMGLHVAYALRVLTKTGALTILLPELEPMIGFEQGSRYHSKTVDEHTFDCLDHAARANASLRVRMALLFHDAGKPWAAWRGEDGRLHYYANPALGMEDHEINSAILAAAALHRLNAPRDLRRDVDTLVRRHMLSLSGRTKPTKIRRWRAELGDDLLRDLIVHRMCDVLGKETDPDNLSDDATAAFLALGRIRQIADEARLSNVPTSVRDLALSGGDLKAIGFEGRAIGEMQRRLLHEILANPDLNDRDWLERRARALRREHGSIVARPVAGAEEEFAPDDRPTAA